MGKKWEKWERVFFTVQPKQRIAYPGKGRLSAEAAGLLQQIDIPLACGRQLYSSRGRFESVALRAQDIPFLVQQGAVDFGITGLDLVLETQADVVECARLPFGFCKLVLAAPAGMDMGALDCPRIATSFPNLTRAFLQESGLDVEMVLMSGSVEAAVRLGVADAVVDLVQTGTTLKENGLMPLQTLLSSCAVLIANRNAPDPSWLYA